MNWKGNGGDKREWEKIKEDERPSTDAWAASCQDPCVGKVRPKRDFRFQVIQVRQGPKWFIWPSRRKNKSEEDIPKANNNNVTNNIAANVVNTSSRRSFNRNTKRSVNHVDEPTAQAATSNENDEVATVTAVPPNFNGAASEPTTRRLSAKIHKAKTEPITTSSTTSSTFKILSISKKWDSFGNTDDELEDVEKVMVVSCRQMSLNLEQPSQNLSASPPNNANQVR
ncbi:unnamed protein product [Enterobius vermicularis]|uniref:PWWP domain-containing protein n=1 Tax=Enterobius vermicularis TaxID=51028 RepID=A0A0N4VR76_ENTVE|nr:unnamed protein product [Enterobius vermicularis]